jgi:hypothetical protein
VTEFGEQEIAAFKAKVAVDPYVWRNEVVFDAIYKTFAMYDLGYWDTIKPNADKATINQFCQRVGVKAVQFYQQMFRS